MIIFSYIVAYFQKLLKANTSNSKVAVLLRKQAKY